MIRGIAVSAISLALLIAARTADAKCAGPGITAAPASGQETAGVSWVFAPSHRQVRITAASRFAIETDIEKVAASDALVAYRVEVRFRGPGTSYLVSVDDDYGRVKSFSYRRVEPSPAPAGPVMLEDPRRELDRWTCSHTDAVVTRPSVAADAYRIEWAPSEAAYRAGDRSVLVVPAAMSSFWGEPDAAPAIELGHLNCFGETIPAAALAETVYLGIAPLGPWATPPIPEDPIAVRSGEPPLVEILSRPEPVEYRCGLAASYEDRIAPAPERRVPLGLLLAVLAALASLPLAYAATRRLSPPAASGLDALSLPQLALVTGALAIAGPPAIAAVGGAVIAVAASLAGALGAARRG